MPIYDYRCNDCGRRSSLLFQTYAAAESAACPRCGSRDLARLVTRFAVKKSEESRLDDLGDPSAFGDVDENDPRSVARWARRMGQELGDDLGTDYQDMIDRMEAGEMPDDDEAAMGGAGDEFD